MGQGIIGTVWGGGTGKWGERVLEGRESFCGLTGEHRVWCTCTNLERAIMRVKQEVVKRPAVRADAQRLATALVKRRESEVLQSWPRGEGPQH